MVVEGVQAVEYKGVEWSVVKTIDIDIAVVLDMAAEEVDEDMSIVAAGEVVWDGFWRRSSRGICVMEEG